MNTQPLISIRNLSLSIAGGRQLLSEVSFDVMPSEVLALVGESGSGKTLTSLAITGLLAPELKAGLSGEILFEGRNLIGLPEEDHRLLRGRKLAMVFQEPGAALNPLMKCGKQVAEVIEFHMGLKGEALKDKTLDWFERVRLPDPTRIFNSYPHQLSGGQKQRVMIAAALAAEPSLLLADEPTTALDPTVQAEILALLSELQAERGFGVLFVTHDLGVVKEFSHRAAVMRSGQLVECGPTNRVLSQPSHPYTRGLVACYPQPGIKFHRLPEMLPDGQPTSATPISAEVAPVGDSPLIEVRDISVIYRSGQWPGPVVETKALKGVSLDILRGETLGLVGESGSGKSTLGRVILGLSAPESGSITMDGTRISGLSSKGMLPYRKQLQLVFQDPFSSLNPRMTVGSAIAEAGRHNRGKQRAEFLLDKVGLPADSFHRYPHEFSGGQRQRIVLARALAPGPRFLVCDESVAALDVSVRARVLNLLCDIKDEFGLTLLFISHDMGVIYQMCDRIAVMKSGELKEIGPAERVFKHPENEYTKLLLASAVH
jgi:peptide/nickel transport system ATP-binding protein